MKVFLDTNVWVSAFLAPGLCEELLIRCVEDGIVLTSPVLWQELTEVLARKVSPSAKVLKHAEFLRRQTTTIADVAEPENDNDARLVAAAAAAGAGLFITGDARLVNWGAANSMPIVTPRQGWIMLFPQG